MKFLFYFFTIILLIGFILSVASFFILNNFAVSSLLTILMGTALFITVITSEDFDVIL